MIPQDLIDKAMVLMDKHLDQIKTQATFLTKDGAKGFNQYDSQVIERYTKILMAMTKQSGSETDETDRMSDEELIKQAGLVPEELDNESETSEPE